MYLKSLSLSGFKSFARSTVFEFPTPITGIVGPNGSGKSNVVEAIRWVLGEQSMKSLRGKRGEDLIFNGSDKTARLGRAEVKLTFDNSRKQFPFEFDDVVISRRVLRDGTNEYILNGSVVRLKDIFELLSKVGLGSTQHHVISQGEVDRILWSTPLERQEMVEEALGLREYHIKAREAERKLAEVAVNMKQVEAQRREIQPHLKYLRLQADKMKAHEEYRLDLKQKTLSYARDEFASIAALEKKIETEKAPLIKSQKEKAGIINAFQAEIKKEEKEFKHVPMRLDVNKDIESLEEKRRAHERALGKIEGLIMTHVNDAGGDIPIPVIVRTLRETLDYVGELAGKDSFESLKSGLHEVKVSLESVIKMFSVGNEGISDENLIAERANLTRELGGLEAKIYDLKAKRDEDEAIREDIMTDLRDRERKLREAEHDHEEIAKKLREVEFEDERLRLRREEFKQFMKEAGMEGEKFEGGKLFTAETERAGALRSVERLRIKLEEVGGIDNSVLKEYADTAERDAFLERELEDVKKARKSLEDLMNELSLTLKEKFEDGLLKINKEFQIVFQDIFGGGKAALVYQKPSKKGDEDDEEDPGGIDITLDVPRKRLRSLDMLSGGERALTSVAILFAMTSVNPPPFLVLDETDATLDEANSQRYGDLLERLSKKSQLVVITHNRETMRRAGVLYGVTIGSDAISRILSLKFEEAEELVGTTGLF